ncbi:MAG TPA: SRPBCC family protein [Pilimelia sp.]|nr:SRPBCC family protein [Pilimelia sp.]
MSYTVTRDFSAPPEVVFGTATDPDRWGRWLPSGVTLQRDGSDGLRVQLPQGSQTVRWQVAPDELRVVARAEGQPWSGTLEVVPGAAGGSTARLAIDGDSGRLRPAAEQALARLEDEVADNFNAG